MQAIYIAKNTAFAATAGAKTVLKIITGTAFRIKLLELALFTDGVTASAVPATWDLFISDETTAGTSAGSVPTIQQVAGPTQAHGCTLGHNFTVEGTTYTVLKSGYIAQYMGSLVLPNPLGTEEISGFAPDVADSIGLRINVTANVNVLSYMKFARA
jgi:hypothetical protein